MADQDKKQQPKELTDKQMQKQKKQEAKAEKRRLKKEREAASDAKMMEFVKKIDKKYYPLMAAIAAGLAAYYIYFLGRGGTALATSDFWEQYYDFMQAYRRTLSEGGSIFYNRTLGAGMGTIGTVAYFLMSPFNLLVFFYPETRLLDAMALIVNLKLAMAAFTFGWASKKVLNRHGMEVLIFSMAYALCGFCLSYYYIFMWLDAVILFPVICIAIKNLIKYKKWIGLTLALFVLFITNFYMGYMVGVGSLFVFCALYYYYHKKKKKKCFLSKDFLLCFLRFLGTAGIAALCSMALVYPSVKQLSQRFTGVSFKISLSSLFVSDPFTLYRQLFANTHEVLEGGEALMYTGILTAFCLCLFFTCKKIKKKEKKVFGALVVLFLLIMMLWPLNKLMYAGTTNRFYNYRYVFLFSGILCAIGCRYFPYLAKEEPRKVLRLAIFNILYLVLFTVVAGILLRYKDTTFKLDYVSIRQDYYNTQTVGCLLFNILVILVTTLIIIVSSKKKLSHRKLALLLFVMFFAEMVTTGLGLWNSRKTDYIPTDSWQIDAKVTSDYIVRQELKKLYEKDNGFYRVEKNWLMTNNDNVGIGMPGVTNFTSTDNRGWTAFFHQMGMLENNAMSSYDGMTDIVRSLLGIRYIYHSSSDIYYLEGLPKDGYEDMIYMEENDTALPLAYMVSDKILDMQYVDDEDNNPFEKQEKLLAAMTGRDKVQCYYRVEAEKPSLLFIEEDSIEGYEDIEGIHAYKLQKDSNSGVLRYKVNKKYGDKGTYYAYVYTYTVINKVGTPATNVRCYSSGEGKIYKDRVSYSGNAIARSTRIVNLTGDPNRTNWEETAYRNADGSADKNSLEYDLIFYNTGTDQAILGNSYFYYYDKENFRPIYEELAAQSLEIESMSDTHIKGTIKVTDKDYLYTSIPYEESWKAYVDGKETPVEALLYESCMGIKLDKGTHEVEFVYEPKGLATGVKLSALGVILFLLCLVVTFLKSRRQMRPKEQMDAQNTAIE